MFVEKERTNSCLLQAMAGSTPGSRPRLTSDTSCELHKSPIRNFLSVFANCFFIHSFIINFEHKKHTYSNDTGLKEVSPTVANVWDVVA